MLNNSKEILSFNLFWIVIACAIAASIVIQIILCLKGFYSISADESDRTLLAYYWLTGQMPKGEPWLPFHTIINGLALKIHFDLFITPRIVGFLFGILSLISIIWYSFELFDNKIITILTAFIAVFFPPLVILRTVPLTEIMFIFFIVSGTISLLKWLKKNKNSYLLLSAIFFAFSSSVRYEGWLFSFCFFIYLLFHHKKIDRKIILSASMLLASFPIYWILFNAVDTGNTFGFISASGERYKLAHGNSILPLLKYNLITQFIAQNIIYINFGGIISFFILIFINYKNGINPFNGIDNRVGRWILIPLGAFVLMAVFSLAGIGMPTHAYWRIPLVWNLLLIPFTAHFIIKFADFLSDIFHKKRKLFISAIAFIIIIYFSFQINRLSSYSSLTKEKLSAGRLIKEIIREEPDTKILIDTSNWDYVNIFLASENPSIFLLNSGRDPVLPDPAVGGINARKKIDFSYLKRMKIKYLLFKRDDYKNFLYLNNKVRKISSFDDWTLYKINSNAQ